MVINAADRISVISREIYGHFLEHAGKVIYGGLFVGKDSPIPNRNGVRLDIIEAYREIKAPLLHWPGGHYSDYYHWRDGVGSPEERKPIINCHTRTVEDNSFGTHEFLDICEELNAEPYIVMNVGTATVHETVEWIEYITYSGDSQMATLRRKNGRDKPWNLRFTCMGNEWWFYESAAEYADHYKRYNFFAKDYGPVKMKRLLRGPQYFDYKRTDELAEYVDPGTFDAMTVYQIIPSVCDGVGDGRFLKGSSWNFTDDEYYAALYNALKIDASITRHLGILKRKDKNSNVKIAVDEWGTWYNDEEDTLWYNYSTMRDALIHATVLNIFNKQSANLLLCSLCMSVNGLSSIILAKGDRIVKNPTFYVFKMYQDHQDATLVHSYVDRECIDFNGIKLPCVSHSASVKNGKMLITLANSSLWDDYELDCKILFGNYTKCVGEILTGDLRGQNTFEKPAEIVSKHYGGFSLKDGNLRVTLLHGSIVALRLQ